MPLRSGDGILVGHTFKTRIYIEDGGEPAAVDPGDVTVEGRIDDGDSFTATVDHITANLFQVTVDGSDITSGRYLLLEVDAGPTLNAPTRPLRYPLREEFEEA